MRARWEIDLPRGFGPGRERGSAGVEVRSRCPSLPSMIAESTKPIVVVRPTAWTHGEEFIEAPQAAPRFATGSGMLRRAPPWAQAPSRRRHPVARNPPQRSSALARLRSLRPVPPEDGCAPSGEMTGRWRFEHQNPVSDADCECVSRPAFPMTVEMTDIVGGHSMFRAMASAWPRSSDRYR